MPEPRNNPAGGPCRRHTARRRRGTAMVEFVMCLPVLVFVLVLIWLLGWGLMHQQQVTISDRYTTWKELRGQPVSGDHLNAWFYRSQAAGVSTWADAGQWETHEDLVAAADRASPAAGRLAEETALNTWPRGREVRIAASFPIELGSLFDALPNTVRSRHGRTGLPWRRGQAACRQQVIDMYLHDLDAALERVQGSADNLRQMVQRLYRNGW